MLRQMISPLADKTGIAIRLLRREDAAALDALHRRLSPETIYRRYFSPRKPPCAELENICRLNEEGGGALVATYEGQIVGLAYYITGRGPTAEPAILIEDRFQKQGIGRRLAVELGRLALAQGVTTFTALLLPENQAVLRLIKGSGLPYETRFSHGAREVQMKLTAEPQLN